MVRNKKFLLGQEIVHNLKRPCAVRETRYAKTCKAWLVLFNRIPYKQKFIESEPIRV